LDIEQERGIRGNDSACTAFAHHRDGRIAVGLDVKDRHWAQFAFQFAHEFCHALAGHSNDWREREKWIRQPKANHWLEESLCETASLFALRAMGQSWKTDPPYANWKSYAPSLTNYAQKRLDAIAAKPPADAEFRAWFGEHEAGLRKNATDRDKNNVVASRLLPLFEKETAGWESMAYYNVGAGKAEKSLTDHFREWSGNAPAALRKFIAQLAAVFGL
jgi:hypothetical protein